MGPSQSVAITVKREFGDPYEKDGITLIPAASVRAAGGGGLGRGPAHETRGWGGGVALKARPVGVYVIKDGHVTWQPTVDATRIVLGGQIVAIVFLLALRAFFRAIARR